MDTVYYFRAPWCLSLKIVTIIISIPLLALPIRFLRTSSLPSIEYSIVVIILPISLLVISALFTVRGYQLSTQNLYIQRLFWKTNIDLSALKQIERDSAAMKKSIRTFGNGGLYSISGFFKNRRLGSYRAWATDPAKAIVLHFQNRTVIITPDDPDRFVQTLQQIKGLNQ